MLLLSGGAVQRDGCSSVLPTSVSPTGDLRCFGKAFFPCLVMGNRWRSDEARWRALNFGFGWRMGCGDGAPQLDWRQLLSATGERTACALVAGGGAFVAAAASGLQSGTSGSGVCWVVFAVVLVAVSTQSQKCAGLSKHRLPSEHPSGSVAYSPGHDTTGIKSYIASPAKQNRLSIHCETD